MVNNEWINKAYDREVLRLKPILDKMNNNYGKEILINGYICEKSKSGLYYIGKQKQCPARITIWSEKENYKNMMLFGEDGWPYSFIKVSKNKENSQIITAGNKIVNQSGKNNTLIENAMNVKFDDPNIEKAHKLNIQRLLIMLDDLGIDLTPTEKMRMLKSKKELLENQLEEINKELSKMQIQQK